MKARRWLLIPFGAASREGREDKIGLKPTARPEGGDGGIDAIPMHERISDFANKSEEDTVEDFNAPMWVADTLQYICHIEPLLTVNQTLVGCLYPLSTHCWNLWAHSFCVQHMRRGY